MDKQEFADYVLEGYKQSPNGRMDRFGKEFIESNRFTIRVVTNTDSLSWSESYIGTQFGSTVDYGDRWKAIVEEAAPDRVDTDITTEDDLLQEVRARISRHPYYNEFIEKETETVTTGVVVHLKQNGYAIYPDPDRQVTPNGEF